MTKLEELEINMQNVNSGGYLSDENLATYRTLLEAVETLQKIEALQMPDRSELAAERWGLAKGYLEKLG